MSRLIAAIILTVAGAMPAAAVTIDFEEFNVGDGPTGIYSWFLSQGYEFNGGNAPCGQYGCPPAVLIGDSGSKSLGAANGWGGQDGYGTQVFISMRKTDGGAFAIHSLDLLLKGCAGVGYGCGGNESMTGTLGGGGAANLSVPVGTGDWLNLAFVSFSANGDGFGFGTGTVVQIDNINVSAVPVPAAVWLFGSGLGLLGFAGRKKIRTI